jgi:hypothetical protein
MNTALSMGLLLMILLLGGFPPAHADVNETCKVFGIVTDNYGVPLIGATVMVVGTHLGAMTDANGEYRITGATEGTHDLQATMVGLYSETRSVLLEPDSLIRVDFLLCSSWIARWQLNALRFDEASVTILTEPPLSMEALGGMVFTVVMNGFPHAVRDSMLGNGAVRISVPADSINLGWSLPSTETQWLPLHPGEGRNLDLTLNSELEPTEIRVDKTLYRTISCSNCLLLSDFTPDEWVAPGYRLERTCIDVRTWEDHPPGGYGPLTSSVSWDDSGEDARWRVVLAYEACIVLLREDRPPSITMLPFPASEIRLSGEGRFALVFREGSSRDYIENHALIDVDAGIIHEFAPSTPGSGAAEPIGSVGATIICVIPSIQTRLFDQGILAVLEDERTLIYRVDDSDPDGFRCDTLDAAFDPFGVAADGSLLALSSDPSIMGYPAFSEDPDSFLVHCVIHVDCSVSCTEVDPEFWQYRPLFDPGTPNVLSVNPYMRNVSLNNGLSGETLWTSTFAEDPLRSISCRLSAGGNYYTAMQYYSEEDLFTGYLFSTDAPDEPLFRLSGDAGRMNLTSSLSAVGASGVTMWGLVLRDDECPLGSGVGYQRRMALVSPEGTLLWLGPMRRIEGGFIWSGIDREAVSADGLSFIWSTDRQIQICRLIPVDE